MPLRRSTDESLRDDSVCGPARILIAENRRTKANVLNLNRCLLKTVPVEVAKLVWLTFLDLSQNERLADLSPLADLTGLEILRAENTRVSDLRPLAGLVALIHLDLSSTLVTDLSPLIDHIRRGLPVTWTARSSVGHGICVKDCPLTNPPPEIVKQGNERIPSFTRRPRSKESLPGQTQQHLPMFRADANSTRFATPWRVSSTTWTW